MCSEKKSAAEAKKKKNIFATLKSAQMLFVKNLL